MSKAKGKAKKGGKPAPQHNKADDDLDAILAEFGVAVDEAPSAGDAAPAAGLGAITSDFLMSSSAEQQPQQPATEQKQQQEEQAKEEADEEEEGDAAGESKAAKDKKKKKKKAKAAPAPAEQKAAEDKPAAAAAPKQTKMGRAVAERLAKAREEEERRRKLEEEEEAAIRAEEAAWEAEQKRIAEEKERKRQAKKEKIDRQKAEGTYRTKAQKEAERRQRERLEQMIAAGIYQAPALENPEVLEAAKKSRPLYGKKKTKQQEQKQEEDEAERKRREEEEKAQAEAKAKEEAAAAAAAAASADDEEDDWEAEADEVLAKPVEVVAAVENGRDEWEDEEEEEDELEKEKRRQQEVMVQRGLERARIDKERKQREEEERMAREEQERLAAEAAARKEASRLRRKRREEAAFAARSPDNLRAPISVIMGHVDTGKTKLLDKIRHTNVQEGEAGGITQQIGATYFVKDTLEIQTQEIRQMSPLDIRVPGLLVMDTPGHESFTNLRSRGSSLCDVAILVIDLMHGLEQQTIESLNMLRKRNAPFIVALNKIDRCYGWVTCPDKPVRESFKAQDSNTMGEFYDRYQRVRTQLMEQGLNAALYWENDSPEDTISVVPTSAVTGEGVPDLIWNLISISQTRLLERIMAVSVLQCTVLEVKVIEGLGTTIDVILVNGTLREGDTIVISTMDGPVVTNIRTLLTPPPSREMRIKSEYIHHKQIQGAIGVKIAANDLERAVAGSPVLVVEEGDDVEDIKVSRDLCTGCFRVRMQRREGEQKEEEETGGVGGSSTPMTTFKQNHHLSIDHSVKRNVLCRGLFDLHPPTLLPPPFPPAPRCSCGFLVSLSCPVDMPFANDDLQLSPSFD